MFSIPLLSDVPGPGHYMGYTAMGWMVGWVGGWMDGWMDGWMLRSSWGWGDSAQAQKCEYAVDFGLIHSPASVPGLSVGFLWSATDLGSGDRSCRQLPYSLPHSQFSAFLMHFHSLDSMTLSSRAIVEKEKVRFWVCAEERLSSHRPGVDKLRFTITQLCAPADQEHPACLQRAKPVPHLKPTWPSELSRVLNSFIYPELQEVWGGW